MHKARSVSMKTVLATLVASFAVSQTSSAQMLEEIVVTAQKRSESLQDVPIAVTAINERTIEQAGIANIEGISLRTPNFSMTQFNAGGPRLVLRGVGSNLRGAGGGEPSVATFVDGVYLGRSHSTNAELFDLAAIEVLRGPQGTLWGKNAAAGVVSLKTKRPNMDEFEAKLEGTVGNEDIWRANGLFSGPLTDSLAGKITLGYRERGTIYESVFDSQGDTGDIESQSLRGQLLWQPSSELEVLFAADYVKDERGGTAINPTLWPDPAASTEATNFFAGFVEPAPDFYETLMTEPGFHEIESSGLSIHVDWELGDTTLTSITAYRNNEEEGFNNQTGASLEWFNGLELWVFPIEDNEMFTQELRLAGGSDSLLWQAGVYYFTEETDRVEGAEYRVGALGAALGLVPGTRPIDRSTQHNETDSYAAFGQFTWSVTDNLDLTLGGRYTYEEKDYSAVGVGEAELFITDFDIEADESWSNSTYNAVVNYRLQEDVMVYLSTSTGFKSGGWDQFALSVEAAETPFDEETATNYELGFKTMFMDNAIRLNGAIFRTDYDDLQTLAILDTGNCDICPTATFNAGEAEISGVELELTWAVTSDFQLLVNYGYLDTELDDLPTDQAIYNGNKAVNAPENNVNVQALYETELGSGGELSFRYEYTYQDESFTNIDNDPRNVRSSYELSNFRLGYTSPSGAWEAAAWVKNAFEEEWVNSAFYTPPLVVVRSPSVPRTYGLTVTWRSI